MSDTDNASFCAQDVRERDFTRYAATLFVAPEHRRALLALYAFHLEVSRVRDVISQPLPGEIRLQWWTDAIAGREHGEVTGNPVAAELLEAIASRGLPVAVLDGMIDAHRFDLYDDPMVSMEAFEAYADATEGALLVLGGRILGSEPDARLITSAGRALGIARIIRLLPLHASRRQLYLPADLMTQHGVLQEDVFSGKTSTELQSLLGDLRNRGLENARAARALMPPTPANARAIFRQLALVERELAVDEPNPFRPAERSRLRILWTMWRGKL